MMVHKLKTWPEYYQEVLDGKKKFEIRKYDRNYNTGDTLLLQEYDVDFGYTGRESEYVVTYMFSGGSFGVDYKTVVMSIRPICQHDFQFIGAIGEAMCSKCGEFERKE